METPEQGDDAENPEGGETNTPSEDGGFSDEEVEGKRTIINVTVRTLRRTSATAYTVASSSSSPYNGTAGFGDKNHHFNMTYKDIDSTVVAAIAGASITSYYSHRDVAVTTDTSTIYNAAYVTFVFDSGIFYNWARHFVIDAAGSNFFGLTTSVENSVGTTLSSDLWYIFGSQCRAKNPPTTAAGENYTTVSGTFNVYYREAYTYSFATGDSSTQTFKTVYAGLTSTAASAPTKAGYTFMGWQESSSNVIYGANATLPNTLSSTSRTFNALWLPHTYGVTFNGNGGTVYDYHSSITVTANTAGSVYNMGFTKNATTGWYVSNATYSSSSYYYSMAKIYCNSGDGLYRVPFVGYVDEMNPYGVDSTAKENGNECGGFSAVPESTIVQWDCDYLYSGDDTYVKYCKWYPDRADLYNNIMFGASSGYNVVVGETYGDEDQYDFPTATRLHYDFAGWWTKNGTSSGDWGTQVTASTVVTATTAHTLYAKWTPHVYTMTINYKSENSANTTIVGLSVSSGTLGTTSLSVGGSTTWKQAYQTSSVTLTVSASNSSSYDYYIRFGSAPTSSTYSGVDSATSSWSPDANATVNIYVVQRFSITYDANGGTGTVPSKVYKARSETATLATNSLT
ncbi:MAG: InlB B-repeat-containing protein, partial [Clostridia bacterium]|nr:InlB B-repeat-containing protein [Clostridia bacterium]